MASFSDVLRVPFEVKFKGKPDAGNPHVRFDEGEGAIPSLLYCLWFQQLFTSLSKLKVPSET